MTINMTSKKYYHMDDTVGTATQNRLDITHWVVLWFQVYIYTSKLPCTWSSWGRKVAPPPFKTIQFQFYQGEHPIYDPITLKNHIFP